MNVRIAGPILSLTVVALGLTWRSQFLPLFPFVKKYGADALWALLVFLVIRLIEPRAEIWRSAWIAPPRSASPYVT